jgi:aspartate/methionine/tyrosine aminotransferase
MSGAFSKYDLTPNAIELARRYKSAQGGYIDLTNGNPTEQGLLFPPAILQEAANQYWANRRYQPTSRGLLPARQAIAAYYKSRLEYYPANAQGLDEDNIFITASTSEAYSLVLALLTQPGDNVLIPEVTYPLFDYLADLYHLELRPYRLNEQNDWQVDEESLAGASDGRTRAILFISPHNPTGMIIQEPLPILDKLGIPLICDEVFSEFTYTAKKLAPLGNLQPNLPVFHLNGISKMFALPDMKLGWIALSGTELQDYATRLELLNDTFLSAGSLVQTMLPVLFEKGWDFVELQKEQVRQNIAYALQVIGQTRKLDVDPPDGGYYLFVRVRGWENEDELILKLLDNGVYTHPGYFYGYERGTHIVISCLLAPEKLQKGLEIIRQIV